MPQWQQGGRENELCVWNPRGKWSACLVEALGKTEKLSAHFQSLASQSA